MYVCLCVHIYIYIYIYIYVYIIMTHLVVGRRLAPRRLRDDVQQLPAVQGSGFRVQGSGFRVEVREFRVQGSRLRF